MRNKEVQQSFVRNNVLACFIKHVYHNMFRLMDLSQNMLWYTCLIKHAKTLLRTKDCCASLLLQVQQDALTHNKEMRNVCKQSWLNVRCTCVKELRIIITDLRRNSQWPQLLYEENCLDSRLTVNCEILATCSSTYSPVRTSQEAHSISIK
jgi:hypothetical protein